MWAIMAWAPCSRFSDVVAKQCDSSLSPILLYIRLISQIPYLDTSKLNFILLTLQFQSKVVHIVLEDGNIGNLDPVKRDLKNGIK